MVLAALKLFECRCSAANYLTFRLEERAAARAQQQNQVLQDLAAPMGCSQFT